MRIVRHALQLTLLLVLSSCSKSFLKSGPDLASTGTPRSSETEAAVNSADVVIIPEEQPNQRQSEKKVSSADHALALTQRLNQWQGLPDAQELVKRPIVIELNSFNKDNLVFEDNKQTDTPVLYLLNLNFDIPKSGTMQLRNKKGWYCLAINSNTIIDFNIGVACETTIATATRAGQIYDRFNIVRDMPCL